MTGFEPHARDELDIGASLTYRGTPMSRFALIAPNPMAALAAGTPAFAHRGSKSDLDLRERT